VLSEHARDELLSGVRASHLKGTEMLTRREKLLGVAGAALLGLTVVVWLSDLFGTGDDVVLERARSTAAGERLAAVTEMTGRTSGKVDAALLEALSDPDPHVASQAVRAVGRWTHRDSLPSLKKALHDSRTEVRVAAVDAIGKFRYRDEVDASLLRDFLGSGREVPEVRASAARSLGRMQCWQAMPELVDALEDPDVLVRGRAGAAVCRILGVDFGFRAEASLKNRRRAVREIRSSWQGFQRAHEDYVRRLKEKMK